MKAFVCSHSHLIGTTDLQIGDEHMGHVFGPFQPTENYFGHIQKTVRGFWETSKPDVLFELDKPGLGRKFALVHPTWRGKREREDYPLTTFYHSLESFRPDHSENI